MIKLGPIEFDERILYALRDNNLVVFAGAGVSMGPPSNLASFWKLASDIAQGTGLAPAEPLDRFLGQLQHRKVPVHERAAAVLSPTDSAPNALHHDLLRLFQAAERVRLVTTNFDLHFENAATALFDASVDTYSAPALPLGYDFTGVVHVHGALTRARDLVLTDADFGRAYLTEGWARRFLVDVFRRYTVLFVGYSHNDVVMNYLARALPAESVAGRFALTDEDGSWNLLGIHSIRFNRGTGTDPYKELYEGVQKLAERASRGALDWQTRIAEIAGREPPAHDEVICEVEQALREVPTTRFFTNVARTAEWPKWLGVRKHLDALFDTGSLSERDQLLAFWLAQHFVIEHPKAIFELVAAHGLRLNPTLWWSIGRELGVMKEKPLEDAALNRWVAILLATAPLSADHHVLLWIAERCASQGLVASTQKVFLFMGEHSLNINPLFVGHEGEDDERSGRLDAKCQLRADHWVLNEVWTKLKPHIASTAQPLLSGITRRLEDMHHDLTIWDKASRDWDPMSYGRSAIEPHEQDRYPESVDVLIDAARDALDWLVANTPALADAWIERLITSDVPLLRRLAIHAMAAHPRKTADERLSWLLRRVGLHELLEHHEVHRVAALNYVAACDDVRQAVVDAVLARTLPPSDDWSAEKRTARSHFNWLSWLLQSMPDCRMAGTALATITDEYRDWRPSDHLDLTQWIGSADWVGSQSPWSAEQLLARKPREQLDDLLNFKGSRFDGPDRDGLLVSVREACKQNSTWAFSLARALADHALWQSDLWPAVIRGLQESDLAVVGWRELLAAASKRELHAAHVYDIANLLYALVKDGGRPFALDLLEEANALALAVWQALEPNPQDEEIDDWLSRAINRPAGIIVEFWINGLSLLLRDKTGIDRALPDNYRQWFTMVAQDASSKGGLGRSVLASQAAFLFELDEAWTRRQIIPLFSDDHHQRSAQAWDGFLVWGRLHPVLAEALIPAFLGVLSRIGAAIPDRRRRFLEFYTALAVFYVADPREQLLPALFRHGSADDRIVFASHLGYFLRQMQPTARRQLWDAWLLRYWQDRLQSIPASLDDAEIRTMVGWLPHLGDVFPAAVALVIRSSPIRIEHSSVLFELRESDLVTRYPTETAQLLIFLCNCVVDYHVTDLGNIARRLPTLPLELGRILDESLAHAGASPRPAPGPELPNTEP